LQQDLAAEVGSSCRPIVVVMHYGFDPFSEEARWWDEAQRLAFLSVLRPYNVAAILHGHVHETNAYTMWDDTGKSYNVFSLGSPYYQGQGTNGDRGHFQVFHIKGSHIDAADISWLPDNPNPNAGDNVDLWTGKKLKDVSFQITSTYSGGWGGWAFSKDIDVATCLAGTRPAPDAGVTFCPDGGAALPSDAGANLMINQPDPGTQAAEGSAFDWDDSWSTPDPAYKHMVRADVCGGLGTKWQESGVPTGGWLKIFPDNTSSNASQLYYLADPLVAGQAYMASITMVGHGAYHLNIWDGSKDNAGASVTLDPNTPKTFTVPFVVSATGTPEFQVRIDGNDGAGTTSADVTMWGLGIYAR
jgi:hypothetical protein